MARPGTVSRARRGVLFLDECAEISVSALEASRTPLEDVEIRLARRAARVAVAHNSHRHRAQRVCRAIAESGAAQSVDTLRCLISQVSPSGTKVSR
jgi:predicted ATPase with chaperone activity